MDALYQIRPVELARFAPLVFEAEAGGDEVARGIVADASAALEATLAAVVVPDIAGPLVLGGSILAQQRAVARRVLQALPGGAADPVVTVLDGVAGAAVLALRHGGRSVDDAVFARIQTSLAARR